jgi:hypothetical protein
MPHPLYHPRFEYPNNTWLTVLTLILFLLVVVVIIIIIIIIISFVLSL